MGVLSDSRANLRLGKVFFYKKEIESLSQTQIFSLYTNMVSV